MTVNLKITRASGEVLEEDFDSGVTLWNALAEMGVRLGYSCGGGSQCSTCVVKVMEGHKNLSFLDDEEITCCDREGVSLCDPEVENLEDTGACRLSCSCQVNGDVHVAEPE